MEDPSNSCFRLPLNAKSEIAPWLIGSLLGSLLFGSLILLVIAYILENPKATIWNKIVIYLLLILSCFAWSTNFFFVWDVAIDARDDDRKLIAKPSIFIACLAVMPFSNIISQSYFAWKSYQVTNENKLVGCMLGTLILASFILGLVGVGSLPKTLALNGKDLEFFPPFAAPVFWKNLHLAEGFLWLSAATDVAISSILVFHLSKQWRTIQGFNPNFDSLIKTVLSISVSSSAITSGFSAIMAIVDQVFTKKSSGVWAMVAIYPFVTAVVTTLALILRGRMDKENKERITRVRETESAGQASTFAVASPRSIPLLGVSLANESPSSSKGLAEQTQHNDQTSSTSGATGNGTIQSSRNSMSTVTQPAAIRGRETSSLTHRRFHGDETQDTDLEALRPYPSYSNIMVLESPQSPRSSENS